VYSEAGYTYGAPWVQEQQEQREVEQQEQEEEEV
jgi:hypothetical protein